ncbi:MAG: undecaprenyl-diphosphate phosphatase [Deltaproteobacteria bacterium]|nr:undecaprenyl-diphosphate phosphatase [Deltaproteobacteria bacterium]
MHDIFAALILGIVEGATEFLPVSSTGHLIIAGHLLDFTGPRADAFEVIIQLGAILAVVVLYRSTFLGLIRPGTPGRFQGLRGIRLLVLTSIPASILGLIVHNQIKEYLFHPLPVAWALGIGALAILAVERRAGNSGRFATLDDITPALALGIGFFQCLALWPGFSRSAATIMGGMLLGANRRLAAEYSFLAAVPIMFAATGFDLLKNWSLFGPKDLAVLAVGFVCSFLSALVAVALFIRLLQRMSLRPFAWYRLVLAPMVFVFWT